MNTVTHLSIQNKYSPISLDDNNDDNGYYYSVN